MPITTKKIIRWLDNYEKTDETNDIDLNQNVIINKRIDFDRPNACIYYTKKQIYFSYVSENLRITLFEFDGRTMNNLNSSIYRGYLEFIYKQIT